jgi:hypothetical protein
VSKTRAINVVVWPSCGLQRPPDWFLQTVGGNSDNEEEKGEAAKRRGDEAVHVGGGW